jgi:hypothetical protein
MSVAGARCSFCDIAPVDALVAELAAKYPAGSSVMSHVVNVADEEQVGAWINATASVRSIPFFTDSY